MSFQDDFAFGDVNGRKSSNSEDQKQVADIWVGNTAFAWRKRRIPISKYGQISIRLRRNSGTKTECQKIIDGEATASFYVQEFTDAVVICRMADIRECLGLGNFEQRANTDGSTYAAYINLADIRHLIVER